MIRRWNNTFNIICVIGFSLVRTLQAFHGIILLTESHGPRLLPLATVDTYMSQAALETQQV